MFATAKSVRLATFTPVLHLHILQCSRIHIVHISTVYITPYSGAQHLLSLHKLCYMRPKCRCPLMDGRE